MLVILHYYVKVTLTNILNFHSHNLMEVFRYLWVFLGLWVNSFNLGIFKHDIVKSVTWTFENKFPCKAFEKLVFYNMYHI